MVDPNDSTSSVLLGDIYIYPNESTTSVATTTAVVEEIWTPDVIQRVVSLVVIMILTFVGNTAIITVLTCSKYRKRNNRVNIFIINLAIGDLTVCFATMTTEILFVAFGEWVLGAFGCKFLTYVQVVTLSSTTFILTAMGFDRFMAICRPLRFRSTISRARHMILVSWLLAFVFAVPQVFIFVQTEDGHHQDGTIKYGCRSQGYTAQWQRKFYFTFMTVYILIIPAVIISYCYINVARVVWKQGRHDQVSQNDATLRRFIVNKGIISLAKMKTVKMTFCIIISFIACWTPYFVTTLIRIYSDYNYKIPRSVMAFAETIALLQSAVNPILYGIFNIRLFRGLMEVFCPHKLINKRVNSFVNCNGTNNVYCSGTDRQRDAHIVRTNMLSIRCQDRLSNSATSTDGSNASTSRNHGYIIAESNKNGFRLRVRFTTKDMVHVHDRNGKCLYPVIKSEDAINCECTL